MEGYILSAIVVALLGKYGYDCRQEEKAFNLESEEIQMKIEAARRG